MRSFFEASYPYSSNRGAFAPSFPDYVEDVVLAPDTLLRVPIPDGAGFVIVAFDGDVRARIGRADTALALPTGTTTGGGGSELNPAARRIPALLGDGVTKPTHLCLRAPAACRGSLAFYA